MTCPECGRVFDLTDPGDANDVFFGHDCEENGMELGNYQPSCDASADALDAELADIDNDEMEDGMEMDLQGLIDSGMAWQLEGSVGRAAMDAIEAGWCILGPVGHRDYYGNYVPSRHEVEPGTKGSLEYADRMGDA